MLSPAKRKVKEECTRRRNRPNPSARPLRSRYTAFFAAPDETLGGRLGLRQVRLVVKCRGKIAVRLDDLVDDAA
jgi:hypothetical protein